ncbi:MAG TPA: bifunctional phosphoribosylaminoimidazolecarboxamide formyltransferase/IMP cyclohydrolase, partial [Geminicoccaceae bacterium]|nr:bifunctional phosphoribosylaminoimidazolecarboxamide formyltransferase/IMP cyclohydrolase [Geminicoccaceae bacterium]
MTILPIRRALLSVHDKTGLVELARALAAAGAELVSTGGTARALAAAGLEVAEVSAVTGEPEILDGRVKTLHPRVHGGILARRDAPSHLRTIERHGIRPIDFVVVNLYPFERTLAGGAGFEDCIEQIDVGGPAMIRAAAKNHDGVAVAVDPTDYAALAAAVGRGGTDLGLRRRLAAKAFAHTAGYDAAIAAWLARETGDLLPERLTLAGRRRQLLRYGENPHQRAAFYVTGEIRPGIATARQVQGKELSYNNLNDTDAAFELAAEFEEPAVVIVKHANPCGVAVGEDLAEAWKRALACDPVSAYGGIVALNRPLDALTAMALSELFLEVVIAPGADEAARVALAAKKNLRLLVTDGMPDPAAPGLVMRSLSGGLLVQQRDAGRVADADLKVVTKRPPSPAERRDLLFAFRVAK